ncbi:MAG: SpoIIE family protein phosphatase, partial [Eubacteriales bacterium]
MMKNNLCIDIGYTSINHEGEQLCGDHVDVVEKNDETIIVLADGLGSGVKASILSTLTAKIISTMLAEGMKLEDAVETIAATLPICSVRKVAYSTFTVVRIINNRKAEIIQYDNPALILMRNGESVSLPVTQLSIAGKTIYRSETALAENDLFVFFSDGVEHAGMGNMYNFGWKRENIIDFIKTFYDVGFAAKTLSTILVDECNRLYGGKPADDATVCTVRIRERVPMSLLIGPPSNPDDCDKMMSLFFGKEGKHIVCGGTTSTIASKYLGKPLKTSILY